MEALAREYILVLSALKGYVVFMMGRSKIDYGRGCLLISMRFGIRAMPFARTVVDTKISIEFRQRKKLLDIFCGMLPEGMNVFFRTDRYCDFKKLVCYCQRRN